MPEFCRFVRKSSRCPENKKKPASEIKDSRMKRPKSFKNHLSSWVAKNKKLGVHESKLLLPFLSGAPKLAECRVCEDVMYPGEEVCCSIHGCKVSYHTTCASDRFGLLISSKEFKCPQHACFLCKKKSSLWRCSKCDLASHDKCAAFREYMFGSQEKLGDIICWRHSTDSPPLKPAVPTGSIEEVFRSLVLPCVEKEFNAGLLQKGTMVDDPKPSSYVHINRNKYLTKKKSCEVYDGCTSCGSEICYEDCVCRNQSISCTSACECSEMCTNRPFQEEKRVQVVMTSDCGWGVEADEFIDKGDFIIEYVGEVISDAECEKRLWDMKKQGLTNTYICEVRKDFNIDSTFKGNKSRFLNHSCDPNCNLEKWDVAGKTRLGIFAAKPIEPGEPLTYDYRLVQFGEEVECHCGASNCHGYIGTKKKIPNSRVVNRGAKRRRASAK